jgi:hypothetical protein
MTTTTITTNEDIIIQEALRVLTDKTAHNPCSKET